MNQKTYLIVEQQQRPAENLPELLKELALKYQLDSYQCRQRLIGRGLSLLTKGQAEPLEKISMLLRPAGFTHWLVVPSEPKFVPQRIRSLQISAEKIIFNCLKKQVVFPKGATILAVFADMSGALAARSVQQLLSSHAYRGRDNIRHLEGHKIHKTILQGKPLLDLYLLDEQKLIVDAVRIFPGKFDAKGLGEHATLSSIQNLDRILKLAKEYAGDFSQNTDFGLVNLPGCTLRRENLDDPETQRQNQISLARYGWLLADLERVGPIKPAAEDSAAELTGTVTAALLMQNPALAAGGQLEDVLPLAKEIAGEINKATANIEQSESPSLISVDSYLPAPPPAKKLQRWNKPGFWIGSSFAALAILFTTLLDLDELGFVGDITRQAFSSGLIFFLLSALLFWASFYFVRLKRLVENTPTSKVRSVAMGMVEVKGRAVRCYALLSPMSHTPCVFYRLTRYRRDQNGQWSVSSVSSSDNVPFLLEDNTGQVEIDPTGCRVNAGTRQEGTPGQISLSRLNADSDDKWLEEIIVEGTLLYVLGFAAVKKETGPSLTERKIAALRELKRNPQNIQQFDTNEDGRIDKDEWDAARAAVEEKVLREGLEKKQQRMKQEEYIVIGKKPGRPLIIAESHSERHLTKRYALYSVPLFIAALGTTGCGIYALLNYLQ